MITENSRIEIEPACGHWEVHIDGEFFCSADTRGEAEKEVCDI